MWVNVGEVAMDAWCDFNKAVYHMGSVNCAAGQPDLHQIGPYALDSRGIEF